MRKALTLVAGAALLGVPQVAAAQYMPHLDPNLYILTTMQMNSGAGGCGPMPQAEIDEARLPAPGIMQAYFAAAQAGQPVSPHFRLGSKTAWTLGDRTVGQAELDMQSDPLAVAGNSLDPETLRFFRAGTHQTAQGQWLVTAPDGTVAGVYVAQFQREDSQWKLLTLEVFRADDMVAPIMHYCSEPGDLNDRRVTGGEALVTHHERKLERAQRRHDEDLARAVEAEARAAERPDNRSRAQQATERRARANERQEQLETARTNLAEAREDLEEARADFAELQSRTTQARNARDFRLLDDDGKLLSEQDKETGGETG